MGLFKQDQWLKGAATPCSGLEIINVGLRKAGNNEIEQNKLLLKPICLEIKQVPVQHKEKWLWLLVNFLW